MKRIQFLFTCLALGALVLPTAFFFNIERASANPSFACHLSWELVPAPSFPGKSPVLNLVAHSAPDDVWAVGALVGSETGVSAHPRLFLHWDGAQWVQVAAPDLDDMDYNLTAVTAISPTDAWAVGQDQSSPAHGLIIHWDGIKWSDASVPEEWSSYLADVGHASWNHVWAVGGFGNEPALLFWNGNEWLDRSDELDALGLGRLEKVDARANGDVYVAGWSVEDNDPFKAIAHWDGTEWKISTKIPLGPVAPEDGSEFIEGLAAFSPNDIWLALQIRGASRLVPAYRIVRWHGGSWETMESRRDYYLGWVRDLKGSGPDNIYGLVGRMPSANGRHWNGTNWREFSLPLPKANDSPFMAVGTISESEAWIVGGPSNFPNKHQPYLAHGTSPCAVPERPSLTSPANDQLVQRTDPTLKWNFARGANTFEVIFKSKASSEPTVPVTVRRAKFKPPAPLNRGIKYKWRVRGCNNNGCGQWSAANTFIIAETDP